MSNFLGDLQSFPFYCFPLFLCIVLLRRTSYLSLLFSVTLHPVEYIFPFLLCLLLLFFPQLFVKLPQTITLSFCISLEWGRFSHSLLCTMLWITYDLKLKYFGHLMQRIEPLEKSLMMGKTEGKRRRRQQRMRCLDSISNSMDMNLGKLPEIVRTRHELSVLQFMGLQRVRQDLETQS